MESKKKKGTDEPSCRAGIQRQTQKMDLTWGGRVKLG